ncbi:MAG: reverse transcriptase family protein [Gemmata sp.]
MSATNPIPQWLLLPLPANANSDTTLIAEIEQHATDLPGGLSKLRTELDGLRTLSSYEPAVNSANKLLWPQLESILCNPNLDVRLELAYYARDHMPARACARVLRRLANDPSRAVRRFVTRAVSTTLIQEVALPAEKDGKWDPSGWLLNEDKKRINRHVGSARDQERNGVPVLRCLADVRKLLNIKSPEQLGFFLLASDEKGGPYTTHKIPKRDGTERNISAPKKQLKWVQKQILRHILSKVPPHAAAHGFVNGRSTVSNATPHVGAELVVKFDLEDFFPTVHYFRVMGLFASLGYSVDNCMFGTDDESEKVAPVLARLCCYTPDPTYWGTATLPQGAPTSPAVSNLVCRRLDARLAGLAKANKGTYTRYADDLTFSFPKAEGMNLGRFRWWVDQVCQQEGFVVNQQKFRVIRDSQRQVVTGIVVNEAVRVPRELRRELRAILHNCEKNGLKAEAKKWAAAVKKHDPVLKCKVRPEKFAGHLRGIAAYLNMVQPEHGGPLLRRVNELLGAAADDGADASDAEKGGGE